MVFSGLNMEGSILLLCYFIAHIMWQEISCLKSLIEYEEFLLCLIYDFRVLSVYSKARTPHLLLLFLAQVFKNVLVNVLTLVTNPNNVIG